MNNFKNSKATPKKDTESNYSNLVRKEKNFNYYDEEYEDEEEDNYLNDYENDDYGSE